MQAFLGKCMPIFGIFQDVFLQNLEILGCFSGIFRYIQEQYGTFSEILGRLCDFFGKFWTILGIFFLMFFMSPIKIQHIATHVTQRVDTTEPAKLHRVLAFRYHIRRNVLHILYVHGSRQNIYAAIFYPLVQTGQ